MAKLSIVESLKIEALFRLSNGYVLDFTNQSFQQFIKTIVGLDIYNPKYAVYGESKGKRLKALFEIETDLTVGKILQELLLYHEASRTIYNQGTDLKKEQSALYESCVITSHRLMGKPLTKTEASRSEEDFMKMDVDEVALESLRLDGQICIVLNERILEVKKALNVQAALSVIFMCGSILEGVLLATSTNSSSLIKMFNEAKSSPKDRESGKVKKIHDWTLSNLIDVAYEVNILGLDVKNYSHTLRDFRNYIHPLQQLHTGFKPDKHTASISWQVLKAALHDIQEFTTSSLS